MSVCFFKTAFILQILHYRSIPDHCSQEYYRNFKDSKRLGPFAGHLEKMSKIRLILSEHELSGQRGP